ncbi:MAG: hypothetical protein JHD16_08735 [Solirubrobacteraceae bacterium]|nr:hypothetical protein [Solirubrobacteraceae bacterium]
MIVLPARALTRLIALIVLPVLGIAAAVAAVAAIVGGATARSLAEAAMLTDAWRQVGDFLDQTAPSGGSTVVLAAAGAVLGGVVLLIGALAPARERELTLDGDRELTIRRRALQGAAASLAGSVRDTTGAKVRVRTRRLRGGGRLRVRATQTPRGESSQITHTLAERVRPLATAFSLRLRVRSRTGTTRKSRIA